MSCNFPGLALIMWNGLYTTEKMVIQWTLLSEACYFAVQFLGDLTCSVYSLIVLVMSFCPKESDYFLLFDFYVNGNVDPVVIQSVLCVLTLPSCV